MIRKAFKKRSGGAGRLLLILFRDGMCRFYKTEEISDKPTGTVYYLLVTFCTSGLQNE